MRIQKWAASFVFLMAVATAPVPSYAAIDIGVSINLFSPPPVAIAPPPLPVYVVPPPPVEGYVWTPGHWRWTEGGYFWVPGTWVAPPAIGVLWTPGYWGWSGGSFLWHEGYWGPHVGFYGGVNYGGGYTDHGFIGGGWSNGHYVVDRSVVNVTNVTNVTNTVSFNGGPGGLHAAPTPQEEVAEHEHHVGPTGDQMQHVRAAGANPAFLASANHGRPPVAATPRAGAFTGHGVVAARQAGRQTPEAEQHNASIRQNPAAAHGVVPKTAEYGGTPRATPAVHPAAGAPHEEMRGHEEGRPIEHPAAGAPHEEMRGHEEGRAAEHPEEAAPREEGHEHEDESRH